MERSSRPLHLLTIGVVTLLALAPTAEVGAQELEVVLEVYSGSTSYVVLEAGMAAGATDGYDPGIDIYAPPPPPIPSFDAAITWANDRWYRSIIAPTPLEVVFGIALQFDGPAGIGIDWDPSALASQGSFQLQDPFGGLFVDIDMTVESGVVLTSTSLTTLLIIVEAFVESSWLRGDVNSDGSVDISDSIGLLNHLFSQASIGCLDAADSNDDGSANIADAVYQLAYLFSGGSPPPEPFPLCGPDPTVDTLDCANPAPCP